MPRVAIVGGGVAGSAAARELCLGASRFAGAAGNGGEQLEVDLFDMGRQNGGRMGQRALWVDRATGAEVYGAGRPDKAGDWQKLAFDHGCQFVEAADAELLQLLQDPGFPAEEWRPELGRAGWISVEPAGGRHVHAAGSSAAEGLGDGFLGILRGALRGPSGWYGRVFVGGGAEGIPAVCHYLQKQSEAAGILRVHQRRRVSGINRATSGAGWELEVDGANHLMASDELKAERQAGKTVPAGGSAAAFDCVILTEHMAWNDDWHPCHVKGLREAFPGCADWVLNELGYDPASRRFGSISALFTLMVAFDRPLPTAQLDVACIAGSGVLQLAVNQGQKRANAHGPGSTEGGHAAERDECDAAKCCWVLVSTLEFAEQCLTAKPMSCPADQAEASDAGVGAAFQPQQEAYLRAEPAEAMLHSFLAECLGMGEEEVKATRVVYSRCQRWGAAYPACRPQALQGPVVDHGAVWEVAGSTPGPGTFLCAGDYVGVGAPGDCGGRQDRHVERAFKSGRAAARLCLDRLTASEVAGA